MFDPGSNICIQLDGHGNLVDVTMDLSELKWLALAHDVPLSHYKPINTYTKE